MTAGCGLERRPSRTARATAPPAIDGRPPLGRGRVESIHLGPFRVEAGATIPDLVVAFRHDGPPPPAPQVLVVHALTGSADAAGDWWAPLIGPGRALDTDRVGVLCANLLGGCYGTTGPRSPSPADRPGVRPFPDVSVRDQARAQWALLDALHVARLALVAGGSLGGMVALEVALERPCAVEAAMPIAAPAATGPLALAWNHLQLELVDRLGDRGLDLARRLAMTTYRSEADFGERFGRRREPDGRYAVTSYLEHQGHKLVDRFDGDTYRVLVEAIDGHDIGRDRGGARQALACLAAAGARLTGVGIEGDILYGPDQVRELVALAREAGVDATYREIRSTKGHDAFLVEWDQLATLLGEHVPGSS
jgi:homoserine O-acetyltransferase/O-succinyltransferase